MWCTNIQITVAIVLEFQGAFGRLMEMKPLILICFAWNLEAYSPHTIEKEVMAEL